MANTPGIKIMLAAALLGYVPGVIGGEKVSYPTERVASFVVEELDVTSLPVVYRGKKEKGKKTFADYGYVTRKLDDSKALVEASSGARVLSISVLQANASGIYACVAKVDEDGSHATAQSVIVMKRKESHALLKGSESSKEFASCPPVPAIESGGDGDAAFAAEPATGEGTCNRVQFFGYRESGLDIWMRWTGCLTRAASSGLGGKLAVKV